MLSNISVDPMEVLPQASLFCFLSCVHKVCDVPFLDAQTENVSVNENVKLNHLTANKFLALVKLFPLFLLKLEPPTHLNCPG